MNDLNNKTFTFNGFKVIVRQPFPKMQLASNVPVTDEFRAEINAWMLEFFGTDAEQVYVCAITRTMFVTPNHLEKMKEIANG
jgi:hypothetical protein